MRSLLGLQEQVSPSNYHMSFNNTVLSIYSCQFQIYLKEPVTLKHLVLHKKPAC